MSTSVGSKKSRKDFGFANNLVASLHSQKESVELTAENPTIEETAPQAVEPTETIQSSIESQPDAVNNAVTEDHKGTTQTASDTVAEPQNYTSDKPTSVIQDSASFTPDNSFPQIRTKNSKRKGQAKSIYFDQDIYEYLQNESERKQVYFSALVNYMLREYIDSKNKPAGKE